MSNYETILFEQSGETVTVTLNQPKFNFFTMQMQEELIHVWRSLRTNMAARFVILTGQGENFTAGADVQALNAEDIAPAEARKVQLTGHEMMRSLESLEQVTVCAMRGASVGAGMAVAQACDFRIMTEDSFYSLPESMIGSYYTWGATPRLVRMVGASKAMEIVMTGDLITAHEAYRLNLANKVVPNDSLLEATHEFIAKIAAKGPASIRLTKKIALAASLEGLGNMFIIEPELFPLVACSGDLKEGIDAFLQKRKPKFSE